MDSDHVIERELADEADGIPTLILLGYQYGIEDCERNVVERSGRYVRLTRRGQRELHAANRRPRDF